MITIQPTNLPEVLLIDHRVYCDERGFFYESYNHDQFSRICNFTSSFVQDNHSRSCFGVLRGIHYQLKKPQGKLVRVTKGRVYDVAVDLRKNSNRFGQWIGVYLDEVEKRSLWIPEGFGHAFLALSEQVEFQYKCTSYYDPSDERSIVWDDATLAIQWPLHLLEGSAPKLSLKDSQAPSFLQGEYPL